MESSRLSDFANLVRVDLFCKKTSRQRCNFLCVFFLSFLRADTPQGIKGKEGDGHTPLSVALAAAWALFCVLDVFPLAAMIEYLVSIINSCRFRDCRLE